MFWIVTSARDEMSLRQCSGGTAQLCTLKIALVVKKRFVGSQASFELKFLYT